MQRALAAAPTPSPLFQVVPRPSLEEVAGIQPQLSPSSAVSVPPR